MGNPSINFVDQCGRELVDNARFPAQRTAGTTRKKLAKDEPFYSDGMSKKTEFFLPMAIDENGEITTAIPLLRISEPY